jgi:hypothetical protein
MGHHGNSFISFAVAVAAQFASMYESFQALTSVQVSHFVEWFSGSVFDSDRWVLTQVVSSGTTAVIDDSIDGGVIMNSNSVSQGSLSTGGTQHYDPAGAIFIASIRHSSTIYDGGYGFSQDTSGVGTPQQASFHNRSASAFILGQSGDGGVSETATDVPPDLNSHTHKIELTSSNILYTMDGVLKLTKTTNRPTTKQMPILETSSANGAGTFHCFYLECFNTSVSILSSLHERLSPLTQVLKQRVVETFSGSVINERWTFVNLQGTGSGAIEDAVGGGYKVSSGSNATDRSAIGFNNKRQYDETDSVFIIVGKRNSGTFVKFGAMNTISTSNINFAAITDETARTNKALQTGDGSSASATEGSVAIDTAYHNMKVECSSANIKSIIDGVLDVTKTTNRPVANLQPMPIFCQEGGSVSVGSAIYCEAYNKLATETDFPSVYELFNPLTTIARQHFWEWFDGNDLSSIWNKNDLVGTNTFQMADAIDEGFEIVTGAGGSDNGQIDFNAKRHYDPTECIMIAVARNKSLSANRLRIGLGNTAFNVNVQVMFLEANTQDTNFELATSDATLSFTATDVTLDSNFHSIKLEGTSANVQLTLDGVLKVTKTTNRPTSNVQPQMYVLDLATSSAKTGQCRYLEVFNTSI